MKSEFTVDLKDFQIINSLGLGSFGEVYLVEQKSTNKNYIAKVCNQSFTDSTQKSFSKAISSFRTAKNPAIVQIIGFSLKNFVDEPFPTIITEYMPKGSLNEFLEKESLGKPPINWNTSKKYLNILGIALGMQYLHSKGIINRDLKPQNILIDENMYPHIGDFSLYKIIKSTSPQFKDSDTCISIYTAPEVISTGNYSNKVDVYSFAYIVYELVLGRPIKLPENEPLSTSMKGIIAGKRPDLSMIAAPAVKELLEKCWSKDPNKRPSFNQVIELVGNREFYTPFNIYKKEVLQYLDRFPDDVKGKKFILSQINEDINEDQARLDKLQRKKNPLRMFVILVIILIGYAFIKQNFMS